MSESQQFDPTKATIGVHARQVFIPKGKAIVGIDQSSLSVDFSKVSPGDVGREWASDVSTIGKVAHSTMTASTAHEWVPEAAPDIPSFPSPSEGSRFTSPPVDVELRQGPALKFGRGDSKDRIKARIAGLRQKQTTGEHKPAIQARVDAQEASKEQFGGAPTDISVNRRQMDQMVSEYKLMTAGSGLDDDSLSPIKIMIFMDETLGDDWKEWEPETILETLEKDGLKISRVNTDKVMAIKVLFRTNEFWVDPRVFEKVCLAFAGRIVDWGTIQMPRVHDLAACIALVDRYINERQFSEAIKAYIAGCAIRDGYVMLPPELGFASGPFAMELASTMGDASVEATRSLMDIIKKGGEPDSDQAIQYVRILRCQYHVRDAIEAATS